MLKKITSGITKISLNKNSLEILAEELEAESKKCLNYKGKNYIFLKKSLILHRTINTTQIACYLLNNGTNDNLIGYVYTQMQNTELTLTSNTIRQFNSLKSRLFGGSFRWRREEFDLSNQLIDFKRLNELNSGLCPDAIWVDSPYQGFGFGKMLFAISVILAEKQNPQLKNLIIKPVFSALGFYKQILGRSLSPGMLNTLDFQYIKMQILRMFPND